MSITNTINSTNVNLASSRVPQAGSNRLVLFGASARHAGATFPFTVSSLSWNGVAATKIANATASAGGDNGVDLWVWLESSLVSIGAGGTFSITWNQGTDSSEYTISEFAGCAQSAISVFQTYATSSATDPTNQLNIVAYASGLVYGYASTDPNNNLTWTGSSPSIVSAQGARNAYGIALPTVSGTYNANYSDPGGFNSAGVTVAVQVASAGGDNLYYVRRRLYFI